MSDPARRIPRDRPRLLFETAVPDAWWECHERPVAGGELVLLACGWSDDRDRVAERPALIALDARTGRERFRLEVPVLRPGASEGQVAPPALLPDGGALVPVYQWDAALTLYRLDGDGRTVRADQLGEVDRMAALHLHGSDSGIKLFVGQPVVAGSSYLVSWVYRSRSNHLMCRGLADGRPRWESGQWLLACADGLAIGETDPPRGAQPTGAEWLARDVRDGHERWRLAPEDTLAPEQPGEIVRDARPPLRTFAGMAGDALVLVDRARRRDATLRRERDVLDRAVESEADDPDWDEIERRWDAEHGRDLDEDLVAHDGAGAERWRLRIDGQVVSAATGSRGACAIAVSGEAAALVHVDGGAVASRTPLPLDPGELRPARRAPRVVALDDELVLWASASEIVCAELARPGVARWRLSLPAPCECDPPRLRDRDLRGASIAVSHGRLHLRAGRRAWGFG